MTGRVVLARILLALGLLLAPLPAMADQPAAPGAAAHPLQPLDAASPRSTLLGFLANGDAAGRFYRDVYRDHPTVANLQRMVGSRLRAARRAMDLSEVPPAIRDRRALDASAHLYEVLSRIELPPAEAIPGPEAVEGDAAPSRWTVPHTDITLLRVEKGHRRGDYLFSPETVDRAAELYELARALPYRRPVPTGDVVELRRVMGGFLIPPRVVEALPGWARAGVLGVVVWKWIALIVVGMALAALLVAARWVAAHGRRRYRDRPVATSLLRLVVPLAVLAAAPIATLAANAVINVPEEMGSAIRLAAQATAHLVGAWIAWVLAVTAAEVAIASPRIVEGTLDAQVLRLCARVVGLMLAVTLILIGGEQIGLPLLGLLAGLGIGGLAIALAAQDTLRNILGSLMIFFDRPYRAGHRIVVLGHDGEVERIGLRSTRIRLLNGHLTTIPNEKMASADIENVSLRPHIRRVIRLGLTYDTSPEKLDRAIAALREILADHAAHWGRMPPRVYFEDFAPDSLTLVAYTWYHPPDFWAFSTTHDRINMQILRRFAEEGIGFAFPTTTTVLEPGRTPITVDLTGIGRTA